MKTFSAFDDWIEPPKKQAKSHYAGSEQNVSGDLLKLLGERASSERVEATASPGVFGEVQEVAVWDNGIDNGMRTSSREGDKIALPSRRKAVEKRDKPRATRGSSSRRTSTGRTKKGRRTLRRWLKLS